MKGLVFFFSLVLSGSNLFAQKASTTALLVKIAAKEAIVKGTEAQFLSDTILYPNNAIAFYNLAS